MFLVADVCCLCRSASNIEYVYAWCSQHQCVRACVRACARVRACVRACVCGMCGKNESEACKNAHTVSIARMERSIPDKMHFLHIYSRCVMEVSKVR